MFKFAAFALALGATGAMGQETMTVNGREIEVVRMACDASVAKAGPLKKCVVDGAFTQCADSNSLCVKKNLRFASCRTPERIALDAWADPRIIVCDDGATVVTPPVVKSPVVTPPVVTTEEPKKPQEPAEMMKKKEGFREFDEGNRCSDEDFDKGCECAGRLWRCADRDNLIAKACDVGFQCIRKNKFYGICADPTDERSQRLRESCEWDMTIIPCGEHVGEYKPELLLKRGQCPP